MTDRSSCLTSLEVGPLLAELAVGFVVGLLVRRGRPGEPRRDGPIVTL